MHRPLSCPISMPRKDALLVHCHGDMWLWTASTATSLQCSESSDIERTAAATAAVACVDSTDVRRRMLPTRAESISGIGLGRRNQPVDNSSPEHGLHKPPLFVRDTRHVPAALILISSLHSADLRSNAPVPRRCHLPTVCPLPTRQILPSCFHPFFSHRLGIC